MSATRKAAGTLLLLGCCLCVAASDLNLDLVQDLDGNGSYVDWSNDTQLLDNATTAWPGRSNSNSNKSNSNGSSNGNSNGNSNKETPRGWQLDEQQIIHLAIFAIAMQGLAFALAVIFCSLAYCHRRQRRRVAATAAQHRAPRAPRSVELPSMPEHNPDAERCLCQGCVVARQMLRGMVLQRLVDIVEC